MAPPAPLSLRALNRATLARQGLLQPVSTDPADAVRRFGSLQAQHPEWPPVALAARAGDRATADLAAALERRTAVRSSLMRITIHVVAADDLWPMFTVMRPLRIDPEDNFSIFTTAQIKTAVEQFEATGLTGPKDKAWYKQARQDIFRSSIHGKEQFYDMLDTLFCTVSFDTINPYNPYEEMIKSLSKASRGNFRPGTVSDEEVNPSTRTVRFSLGSKVYERDAEQHGGLLSPEIIDDVNKALEEEKAGGAFYTVLSRDKVCLLVYIEDKNVEKAKNSGLFTEFTKGTPERLRELYRTSPVM